MAQLNLVQSIWRFITLYQVRVALGWVKAGDELFTSSPDGISAAFDIAKDGLVENFTALRSAVADLETVLEGYRVELEDLEKEEQSLIGMRNGALAKFEKAQTAKDEVAMAQHQAAFERFDKRIQAIDKRQAELNELLSQKDTEMAGHMLMLTKLQGELKALPAEKAQAIAEFVSNTTLIALRDRINGIKTNIDRGPIDAVRAKLATLRSTAKVAAKLDGADVEVQDEQYAAVGATVAAGDRMQQMLAARKAERDARTGGVTAVTTDATTVSDRPKI